MSFLYWSWWPLIAAFVVNALLELSIHKWVPLKALSQEQVTRNRKLSYLIFATLALLLIIAGLTDDFSAFTHECDSMMLDHSGQIEGFNIASTSTESC